MFSLNTSLIALCNTELYGFQISQEPSKESENYRFKLQSSQDFRTWLCIIQLNQPDKNVLPICEKMKKMKCHLNRGSSLLIEKPYNERNQSIRHRCLIFSEELFKYKISGKFKRTFIVAGKIKFVTEQFYYKILFFSTLFRREKITYVSVSPRLTELRREPLRTNQRTWQSSSASPNFLNFLVNTYTWKFKKNLKSQQNFKLVQYKY